MTGSAVFPALAGRRPLSVAGAISGVAQAGGGG
jgi:hypothetical protein